jgi:hypothetical protein
MGGVMRWDVACPSCGGPGRLVVDVFGVESIACDAYWRCRTRLWDGKIVPQAPSETEWYGRLDRWRGAA